MTGREPSAAQDLHIFLADYRHEHPEDVVVIDDEVSPDQDVTGIVWELAARGRDEMLVCSRVAGMGVPLVTNVFASRRRVARILGAPPSELHERYQSRARSLLDMRILDSGPVLDSVESGDGVDLASVPMITHFASDRAAYITSGIIVAEHAGTGVGNLSYHRAMVRSRNELATSLHSRGHLWALLQRAQDRGEVLPVAMVIGGHPLFMLAASARVGADVDERRIAGGLFGEALDVVRTPRHALGVPATADLVLEGVLDPAVVAEEGPFGEFTGYSSNRSTNTLFRVETIMRRRDGVLLDVVGGNSAEHLNLARIPRESEMAEKLKERFPSVVAVHYPSSGTHFHCYVALRQRRSGEARQVMLGLLGWDPYLKTVIAVDEDVDVTDDAQVLWALATHFQPHEDLFTIDGLPGSPLDPSSSVAGTTSRMAMDATRGPGFDGRRVGALLGFQRAGQEASRRARPTISGGRAMNVGSETAHPELASRVAARDCDLLLTGGTVVTVDDARQVFDPGAVAVVGERIAAVGPADSFDRWTAHRTIDCRNRALMPGLVDCHNHLFQVLARGLGEGMTIRPWLCEFMWPYSIAMSSEDARVAATLAAIEAVRAGTTTVIDNHYAPTDEATTLAVADAIASVGLRGAVVRGILGEKSEAAAKRGQPDALFRYTNEEEIEITGRCMEQRPPGSLVSVWPAPLNLTYVDQSLVRESVELARRIGTRWHTHCSEGSRDPESYVEAYGIRPVEWLHREGLLDDHATLAHAIWLDDREVGYLGDAGAGVAYNPVSNAYLASGCLRLPELAAAGAVIGLGSDGPSCGHRQDLFECMKLAIFSQRLHRLDPMVLRCETALELATRQGARLVGIDAGELAPGRLADITVVGLDRPHLRPLHRAVATLVYSARGSDVDLTVVGGRVVFEEGRCLFVDESTVMVEAQRRADDLMRRGGFEGLRSAWAWSS